MDNKLVVFLFLASVLFSAGVAAEARQPKKVPRIAYLSSSNPGQNRNEHEVKL